MEKQEDIKQLQINKTQSLSSYTITQEIIDERNHIIVPVVMMTEGVRSGSKGAMLHTAENLSQYVSDWTDVPVTIHHPRNEEGHYISANSPGVEVVGKITNPRMDGKKLMGNAVIDEQKLIAASPTAHQSIMAGTPLEVSIGAFTHEIEMSGEFDGKQYNAVTQAYTPDHLALLPGGTGACNWNDGCGIRVNQNNNQNNNNMTEEQITKEKELQVNRIVEMQTNVKGFRELVNNIGRLVDSWDNDMAWNNLEEVFESNFIYRRQTRNRPGILPTLYKQDYTITDKGEITLTGEPVPVAQNISYSEINSNQININKNEKKMERKSKCTPCQVDALLANSLTNFTAEDREWLQEQTVETIEKLTPKTPPAPQVNKEEPVLTDEKVAAYIATKAKEDIIKLMPEDLQANITSGLELREARRKAMIEAIQANSKDVWTVEELEAMNCNMLEKLSKTTGVQIADYSAAGGGAPVIQTNKDEVEPMMPLA